MPNISDVHNFHDRDFFDCNVHFADRVCFRFKVMDDDAFQKDRMLGWACFRLDRMPQGLRLFPLKDANSLPTSAALLLESHLELRE